MWEARLERSPTNLEEMRKLFNEEMYALKKGQLSKKKALIVTQQAKLHKLQIEAVERNLILPNSLSFRLHLIHVPPSLLISPLNTFTLAFSDSL